MSSVNPAPTTPMDNGPTGLPGGGRGGDNQMSNLYLYTFLATLLLLLAISMLIVGRSVFIRRRTRRVLEEAARGGTTVPLQTVRSTVKLGAKPKLFDVYTTVHETPSRSPLDGGLLTWANLKPLSATLRKPEPPSPQSPVPQSSTPSEPPSSLLLRLVPQLRPLSQSVAPDPHAHPPETSQPSRDQTLTVSVLIAMPTPPSVNSHQSFKDTFPPDLVGVIHLPIPHGWNMDAKSGSS